MRDVIKLILNVRLNFFCFWMLTNKLKQYLTSTCINLSTIFQTANFGKFLRNHPGIWINCIAFAVSFPGQVDFHCLLTDSRLVSAEHLTCFEIIILIRNIVASWWYPAMSPATCHIEGTGVVFPSLEALRCNAGSNFQIAPIIDK